jgi:hypothetical protein
MIMEYYISIIILFSTIYIISAVMLLSTAPLLTLKKGDLNE